MPHIALATYRPHNPDDSLLYGGEKLLLAPLQRRGYEAEAAVWNDPAVDWSRYAAVVIRACWDYHHQPMAFAAWIQTLTHMGIPLINSANIVRWNMDKFYLRELAEAGVPMLPTVWLEQGSTVSLKQVLETQGWDHAVVKPTISAGGDHTWQTTPLSAGLDQTHLNAILRATGAMIQRYATEISQGEWSLIFFNGIYSHAVLKVPAPGEMFVHLHRGGSQSGQNPPTKIIPQAALVLRQVAQIVGEMPVYARIDGVLRDDEFVLMEVELIEPYLFLDEAQPYAAERAADAIVNALEMSHV